MGNSAAVLGASGYAGGELIRLLDGHPAIDVVHLGANRRAGESLGAVHPHLGGAERVLQASDPAAVPSVDVAFLALPHGASWGPALALLERGIRVVDLGSDFRLDAPGRYRAAYGADHPAPDELGRWPFGLPELFRDAIVGSDRVAVPGCYPTSALLAIGPLVAAGIVESTGIVIDSVSGVTGAGRSLKDDLLFGAVAEGVRAYAVGRHRHRPEIERGLEALGRGPASLVFTPHLVPMQRGLLSTCYLKPAPGVSADDLAACLGTAYHGEPFADVIDGPPQTRWVVGSNRCLLSIHHDVPTGTAIVLAALDNLVKGAAGQAVQCANLMLGLPEEAGLAVEGWLP